MELIADVIYYVSWFFKEPHAPGRVAGVMEGYFILIIPTRIQVQFVVLDQIRGKFANVNHFVGFGALENGAGDRRFGQLEKVSRAIHGVHVLVTHPPHVATLSTDDPLHPARYGSRPTH